MKNINVIPTDKPSRLFIDVDDNKLKITIPIGGEHMMNQHIYITNDEEIKEGDYCISHLNIIDEGKIHNSQTIFNPKTKEHLILLQSCKKIILTTNTDLIKDGIQAIDEEFLEWFIKNPSCEEVEVVKGFADGTAYGYNFLGYKIIIPKEEPKQEQEVCNRCDKTLREQMKGCGEITCYRQFLPRQEKLTYTESAKKEERISNCTMMKRKRETLEEDDQTLAEIKERMKTRELEKTAVEWLIDWMKANQYFIGNDLLEAAHTAKAMEYFQNKKMYERGAEDFVKKVNQLSKPSSNEK